MDRDLGLDALLTGLREAGLRVGFAEVARLRQVFALAPATGTRDVSRRLRSLVRAVVVKSAEDRRALEQLAEEIETSLFRHGLPVERAVFRGVPDRLSNDSGRVFAPREIEDRRKVALVAILTDGRTLTRRARADDRRVKIGALLRQLSHWPRLAFVDFSTGVELRALVEAYGLEVVPPEDLASFLGAAPSARWERREPRDLAVWAAACALAPSPVDERTALELRDHLELAAPSWALRVLRAQAPGPQGRLRWTSVERARRVNWLRFRELLPATTADPAGDRARAPGEGSESMLSDAGKGVPGSAGVDFSRRKGAPEPPGLPFDVKNGPPERPEALSAGRKGPPGASSEEVPASTLDEALRFWEARYERALSGSAADGQDDSATQHLAMERSLVRLWRRPAPAIRELYAFFREPLRGVIREQLGCLTADDLSSGPERIRLPWRWRERTAQERLMLETMGFAGLRPSGRLGRPARLWIALGLCLGLAAMALTVSVFRTGPPEGVPRVVHVPSEPEGATTLLTAQGLDTWQVEVRSRFERHQAPASAGATARVFREQEVRPCVEVIEGFEIWSCGGEGPSMADASGDFRLAILFSGVEPGPPELEELAVALLASGSVDRVIFEELPVVPAADLVPALVRVAPVDQLLVIGDEAGTLVPALAGASSIVGVVLEKHVEFRPAAWVRSEEWDRLLDGFQFTGTRTVSEAWPDFVAEYATPDSVLVKGLGLGFPAIDMDFVSIQAGTFTMGSQETEVGRWSAEGPAHQVTLSAFEIGVSEVTNAQYRELHPDHPGEPDLPAVEVSWTDAKAFCEHFGFRLPTEAEWEYAARAGSQARWSFGDDESQLDRYAWYEANSDDRAHPVKTKEPNAWGVYDMHGNVWEWVEDRWADRYPSSEPRTDPRGPSSSERDRRVVRGGAFFDSPRFLRSAYRNRDGPEDRINDLGFRCARSPRRQP